MHRRKIVIIVIALAAMLVTLLSQQTLAYYSVLGEDTNVITSGEIKIKVMERMGDGEFPLEGVFILPGQVVSKRVSVKNTGANPCWVRVKLIDSINDETLSADVMELDLNLNDWIDGEDGYFYYHQILAPGAETEKLFSQVKIANAADNSYLGKTMKLIVTAYAVQSEYNDASSPLAVNGWPADA